MLTMKAHRLSSTLALVLLCTMASASALASGWQGFYAGVNAGFATSSSDDLTSRLGDNSHNAKGGIAGAQLGYNYPINSTWVVGIQNDFQVSGLSTGSQGSGQPSIKVPFMGNGRARAGMLVMDQHLYLYGTGGLAFGQVNDTGTKRLMMGWTAGGGAEWAFSPQLSAKVELLHSKLSKTMTGNDNGDTKVAFNSITVGVNYHF